MSKPKKGRKPGNKPQTSGGTQERRSGERSEPGRSAGVPPEVSRSASGDLKNPEVPEKAQRRKYSAEYKLRILQEADACGPGELGAMLRREGLYSSHINTWRRQREEGQLHGLTPKKRGRKGRRRDPVMVENQRLRKEIERLRHRLDQADTIIEFQKKVSEILGIPLKKPPVSDGNDS